MGNLEGQAVVSKILVIVDDPDRAPLLTTLLKPQGFVVYSAHNGKDGLRFAYDIHPHLIILDIMMPEISGCGRFRHPYDGQIS